MDLAQAAEALVGTPFRLHGRDPRIGLDCVGVVTAAMAATGRITPIPNGYTLKQRHVGSLGRIARALGYHDANGPIQRNDVVMFRVGPCQFHFGIATGSGELVHAHAGLRHVICGSVPEDWLLCGCWRREATA